MRRASAILLCVVSLLALGFLVFGFGEQSGEPAQDAGGDGIALGAFIPRSDVDPAAIDRYARMTGGDPAVVMWFQDWERNPDFKTEALSAVRDRGAVPMVTWMPNDHTEGVSQPGYSLSEISSGEHDPYIREWAAQAADWEEPMYLRFAHEMNIENFSWSIGTNGNTAADYVRAWRHVYDIFEEEGASNVRWVWSPNYNGGVAYSQVYPGDEYVDWVGIDGYNWGTTRPEGWRSLEAVFSPAYDELTRLAPEKPIMLAEFASAESGGDKGNWIRRGFLQEIPQEFPRIEAVVWFDEDKEADWRVNSSRNALDAFRDVAESPLYGGQARG